VVLEHVEEQKSIGCLVKKCPGIFLFSSGSAVKLFDLRMQSAVIVVDLQGSGGLSVGSKMTLHPTESHLLAVPLKSRAEIFDMRQSKGALLSLPGSFFSLQWSPHLGEHILITGQPTKRKYAHKSVANRSIQARVHKTSLLMSGVVQPLFCQRLSDPLAAQWSPWTEDTLLFSDPSRSSGKLSVGLPLLTAVSLAGKVVGKLDLRPGTHGFQLDCNASKPMLTVGNSGAQGGLAQYQDQD